MSLQEGNRVVLTEDESWSLTKGTTGTIISYQLFGGYEVKFDNGQTKVVDESRLAKA